jgi:thiamine kinase-like enzyme
MSALSIKTGIVSPIVPAKLSFHGGEIDVEFCQNVFGFILKYLNMWSDLKSLKDLKIVRLSQAMSNFVFIIENIRHSFSSDDSCEIDQASCVYRKREPKKILLRIYGEQMEHLLPPGRELKWCLLFSELGIGAKIYCAFSNGRFEEYFDSEMLDVLTIRETETSARIACKVARIHAWIDKLATKQDKKNELWERFDDWMQKAQVVSLSEKQRAALGKIGFPHSVNERLLRVKNELLPLEENFSLVFSHCDLQYGNILRLKHSKRIILIDFEYACFAPPYFDIANHWCEWAANYSESCMENLLNFNLMPSPEEKRTFVRNYLQEHSDAQVSVAKIEEFVQNCDKYIALSHFMWGIWGILKMRDDEQCKTFDYFSYAVKRLEKFVE